MRLLASLGERDEKHLAWGRTGKPCLCPCPQLCLAVFSETAQEVGLHNVRIQEAIGLLKATSCELVIHIHLSLVIRPFGPCHCLEGLQKRGDRQQRLLDTECAIVLNWQLLMGWGGKWSVRRGRLPLIVIDRTMGLGAGVRSCSWEPELLGGGMVVAGTWL